MIENKKNPQVKLEDSSVFKAVYYFLINLKLSEILLSFTEII